MASTEYTIGIDIGGTNTSWGLVSKEGNIIAKGNLKTKSNCSIEELLNNINNYITPHTHQVGKEHIKGVGIGAPNANLFTGEIIASANLPWKGVIPLKQYSEKILGFKTNITNDAKATAIGEMTYGAAKEIKDFIVITLGTGVGSGIVVNGQLVNGHNSMAGEVGHIVIEPNGRQCGCGRRGCLETYTSATGIVNTALEYLEDNKKSNNSLLATIYKAKGNITAQDIFTAANEGDKLAIDIFNDTGAILGKAIANIVAVTEPEAVILFGGLAKAGDYIFNPVQKSMEENLLYCYQNKVKILTSALNGNEAAILGAASLAWL